MFRLLLVAVAIFVSSSAFAADLYLEPYVGYTTGKIKTSGATSAPTVTSFSDDNTNSGVGYGAKVGLSYLNVAFGADYQGGALKEDGTSDTQQDIGVFAQIEVPMLVKFAATYFVSSKISGGGETDTGDGFKIGAGYIGLPLISINVDYFYDTYSTAHPPSGTTYSSFSENFGGLLVSLSVPLSI